MTPEAAVGYLAEMLENWNTSLAEGQRIIDSSRFFSKKEGPRSFLIEHLTDAVSQVTKQVEHLREIFEAQSLAAEMERLVDKEVEPQNQHQGERRQGQDSVQLAQWTAALRQREKEYATNQAAFLLSKEQRQQKAAEHDANSRQQDKDIMRRERTVEELERGYALQAASLENRKARYITQVEALIDKATDRENAATAKEADVVAKETLLRDEAARRQKEHEQREQALQSRAEEAGTCEINAREALLALDEQHKRLEQRATALDECAAELDRREARYRRDMDACAQEIRTARRQELDSRAAKAACELKEAQLEHKKAAALAQIQIFKNEVTQLHIDARGKKESLDPDAGGPGRCF